VMKTRMYNTKPVNPDLYTMRKLIEQLWKHRGTSGGKAWSITPNQVFAIYYKSQEDILQMLEDIEVMRVSNLHAGDGLFEATDHWTDEEWGDYAFEEAN
jgi:hypothetical protein